MVYCHPPCVLSVSEWPAGPVQLQAGEPARRPGAIPRQVQRLLQAVH